MQNIEIQRQQRRDIGTRIGKAYPSWVFGPRRPWRTINWKRVPCLDPAHRFTKSGHAPAALMGALPTTVPVQREVRAKPGTESGKSDAANRRN